MSRKLLTIGFALIVSSYRKEVQTLAQQFGLVREFLLGVGAALILLVSNATSGKNKDLISRKTTLVIDPRAFTCSTGSVEQPVREPQLSGSGNWEAGEVWACASHGATNACMLCRPSGTCVACKPFHACRSKSATSLWGQACWQQRPLQRQLARSWTSYVMATCAICGHVQHQVTAVQTVTLHSAAPTVMPAAAKAQHAQTRPQLWWTAASQ